MKKQQNKNKEIKEITEREREDMLYLYATIKTFFDAQHDLLNKSDETNAGVFMPRLSHFAFDSKDGEKWEDVFIDNILNEEEAHLFRSELGCFIKDYFDRRIDSFQREVDHIISNIAERWN